MPRVKWPLTPFGRAVKKRMAILDPDMTLTELGERVGTSQSYIQDLIRGRAGSHRGETYICRLIMDELGLTVEDIEREEKMVG